MSNRRGTTDWFAQEMNRCLGSIRRRNRGSASSCFRACFSGKADVTAQQATGGMSYAGIKRGLEIGVIILVVLLVILGLIIGFNKLRESEEESEEQPEKGETYY